MKKPDLHLRATLAAERVVKERSIEALPIDPIAIAMHLGIEVKPKPSSAHGVSGMLLRHDNNFGIAYATHISSIGFQNFSVAHELGHYFLPGHIDAVLADGEIHESHAGFASGDHYEIEADHFAAAMLMPHGLFMSAMRTAGDGLPAIERLAEQCHTSLTATAIRYARCTRDPVAIILSTGSRIDYCFMSNALKDVEGINWIRKGEALPSGTATLAFNQRAEHIRRARRRDDVSDLQQWFGGDRNLSVTEEVRGLGGYGKTLTVLSAPDIYEQIEAIEEGEYLANSWTPRFQRR